MGGLKKDMSVNNKIFLYNSDIVILNGWSV